MKITPLLMPVSILAGACVLTLSAAKTTVAKEPTAPIPFIFDTDIGNDCDDVLALGVVTPLFRCPSCHRE